MIRLIRQDPELEDSRAHYVPDYGYGDDDEEHLAPEREPWPTPSQSSLISDQNPLKK